MFNAGPGSLAGLIEPARFRRLTLLPGTLSGGPFGRGQAKGFIRLFPPAAEARPFGSMPGETGRPSLPFVIRLCHNQVRRG
jgi:hypothetical protein